MKTPKKELEEFRKGWTPIRRGHIYCSPRCGGGCTHKAYHMAHRKAQALAKRLGKPWAARVWENLGWHWEVAAKCGRYHFTLWGCAQESYTCAISSIPGAGLPGLYDDSRHR